MIFLRRSERLPQRLGLRQDTQAPARSWRLSSSTLSFALIVGGALLLAVGAFLAYQQQPTRAEREALARGAEASRRLDVAAASEARPVPEADPGTAAAPSLNAPPAPAEDPSSNDRLIRPSLEQRRAMASDLRASPCLACTLPAVGLVERVMNRPPARQPPARVVAPAIGLDTKVVEVGWHREEQNGIPINLWDTPAYVAGFLKTGAFPGNKGNTVLTGHHNIDGMVFRYTKDLKVGDDVFVYADDNVYHYRVVDNFIVQEAGVSEEQRRKNATWIGPFPDERITLLTCWPFTNNTHRNIVIAKPVKDVQAPVAQ